MTDNDKLTIGIVTDCQYADAEPDPPNYFREAPAKLASCVDLINARAPDLVVNLGDTIDHEFSSFETILPIFSAFRSPVFHLPGNHDFAVEPDQKTAVPELLGLPEPPYYRSVTLKGWRLIFLNGNELSLAAHPAGTAESEASKEVLRRLIESGATNARPYNGGVGKEQLGWLDGQLLEADSAGERAIVFNHFPVFPETTHNLWDAEEVVELLADHPSAVAHFNGHLHQGGYAEHGGVHFVTFKALLETKDIATCALITLAEATLTIEGFGNQPSFELPYR